MVQSLSRSFLSRSLSSLTRFLGKNIWTKEQLVEIALRRLFDTLRIKARCVVFLIIDDTIAQKSGKKIPGCPWHKDHVQNMANVFGHQWILENKAGRPMYNAMRRQWAEHPVEQVGKQLRSMMSWITKDRAVDMEKN